MGVVHINERGAIIGLEGERLLVRKNRRVIADIPLLKIDQVQIWGRGTMMTPDAMQALVARKIDVVYMAGGQRQVSLQADGKNSALRLQQADLIKDPARCLSLAKQIVEAKLENQRAILVHFYEAAPGPLGRAISGIEAMSARVISAPDVDVLRGLEGQGAVAYWSGFRSLIWEGWGFETRAYHPPPDPINVLLSFGYTLLLNELVATVRGRGLDPQWGVFHVIDYGRPSLALDLEEEWRPVIVDALVLALVNRGEITPDDFSLETSANGTQSTVRLGNEGRRCLVQAYEQRVNDRAISPITGNEESFRQMFRLQVEEFARAVETTGQPYYRAYRV